MKFVFLIFLTLTFTACNNADKSDPAVTDSLAGKPKADTAAKYIHSFADTTLENKITAQLLKLPFIQKSNQYIDSFSNHKQGIAFMMENAEGNETDISVQAGYNGQERFETYYRLFVNLKTLEIKVYDPVEDTKLTVKEFIKSQKQ